MQQYEVYEFYENVDVIRLCSLWKDDIDGECLQRAVVRAMKRYPYLKVRLALHREELTIQPNFEEIPVYHKSRGLKPLGSKGSGYHLLSIDYDGNCFAFNICHQIVDGNTAHQVLRTIAYAYAQERYGMPDYETVIRKPESELLLGENDTPQVVPRTESDFPLISYESGMELPNSVFGDGEEFYVYNLIMNEADVISFCKKYDLSPNAFVAVFCVKTIGMLFLEPEKPIVCNINQNYGPELGYYNNRHDLVRPINIVYPIKIFEAPYSLLGTLTRGQMILKSSQDYCKQELIDNYNRIAVIDSLNSFAEKLEYARTHARKRDASGTVIISYPGKTELEPLNEYMLYIIPMVFHRFGIAIDAIAGTIRLSWHQKGKGGILINTFIENLKKEGIYVIIKDPLHLEVPVLSQEFTPM